MTTPILLFQRRSMLAWSILGRPTTTTTTSDSIIVLFIGTCVIPNNIYILRASFYRGGSFGEERSHQFISPQKVDLPSNILSALVSSSELLPDIYSSGWWHPLLCCHCCSVVHSSSSSSSPLSMFHHQPTLLFVKT